MAQLNRLLFLVLATLRISSNEGFSFQLPIKLPWETSPSSSFQPKSPIIQNDKVVIFGGTGGVGQLVTKKLLMKDQYNVCVVARDEGKAKELLLPENGDGSRLEVAQLNLVGDGISSDDELRQVMEGVLFVLPFYTS